LSFFARIAYPEDVACAEYTLTQLEHDNSKGGSISARQCVRAVKAMDSESIGLSPRGFDSFSLSFLFCCMYYTGQKVVLAT
jgi:hypothetical protein